MKAVAITMLICITAMFITSNGIKIEIKTPQFIRLVCDYPQLQQMIDNHEEKK